MAFRALYKVPRLILVPSHAAVRRSKPPSLQQTCFIHASQTSKKKHSHDLKKKALIVTMGLTQEVQVFDEHGEDMGMMPKIAAEELARSRDLRIMVLANAGEHHPVMQLCTTKEFVEKQKNDKVLQKSAATPKEKHFTINTKITDHDLSVKINLVVKNLNKGHHVVVKLQSSVPGKEKVCNKLRCK
jgi:translation initiation factor IF-3